MDEFLPTPRGGTIWRKLSFGATAEVFLLDVRAERDPDAGQYVSPEQLQWVIDGVQASTATWKLVCSPVPVAHMGGALDVPLVQNDTWNGAAYAAQRAALLEGLSGVPGVLIVSGDHHFPAVVKADATGPGADLWEIVTGPLESRRQPAFVYLPDSPQLPWVGYAWCATLFALSPSGFARITFVGEDDETLFEGTFDDAGRLLSWEALPVSADDDPPA